MLYLGEAWEDHSRRICRNWRAAVGDDHVVVIPGDVSDASTEAEAEPDLRLVSSLPGTKVLSRGNHDLWWKARIPTSRLHSSMHFLDGTACRMGDVAFCGSMGWPDEDSPEGRTLMARSDPSARDEELHRLCAALEAATRENASRLVVLLHYAPFREGAKPPYAHASLTPCGLQVVEAGADACVYGHLHAQVLPTGERRLRKSKWADAPSGIVGATHFVCVSADLAGFRPVRIS